MTRAELIELVDCNDEKKQVKFLLSVEDGDFPDRWFQLAMQYDCAFITVEEALLGMLASFPDNN